MGKEITGEARVVGKDYAALLDGSLDADIQLGREELDDLRILFAQSDVDGNGHLDPCEFEEMVSRMARARGKRYSSRQLKSLFRRADTDGNNQAR